MFVTNSVILYQINGGGGGEDGQQTQVTFLPYQNLGAGEGGGGGDQITGQSKS